MEGHLNSGEIYSLETVFSNDTNGKVVIPDLQRDYCWGGKGTLVKDFVNNIKKHFSEKGTKHRLMMGLLYGYYEENRPKTLSKILCKWKQDSVVSSPYI